MMKLRHYQQRAITDIHQAWNQGAKNVAYVLPTGGGKTVIFSSLMDVPSLAVAHRQELVSQMSLTLARHGVYHNIIAPNDVIRDCVTLHMQEVKRSYFDSNAHAVAAGIDTLGRRDITALVRKTKRWVCDEAAHLLRNNKWGKVL